MAEPHVPDMRQMTATGRRIENSSFDIVDREAWPHDFDPPRWEVVRRIIHATADFEYKHLTRFSADAIDSGVSALRAGAPIYVDVKMIRVGLNARRLAHFGCDVHCFVSDDDVIATARAEDSTRSAVGVAKAWRQGLIDGGIVAIGNAPTALLELIRLVRDEGARPALVIGMPVGFVNAAESKEALLDLEHDGRAPPFVITRGRKGGSTVVVAALHALMSIAAEDLR
ncbi:MAG: precorrin-8X methylmutase [Deltaproteobacteria bacterium]|nr:MAG: precorrin-8X methylmutase [Deltaproteobacteria bacterium]